LGGSEISKIKMVQKCFNSLNLHLLLEMGGRFLKGIISGNLNLYVYNLLMEYNLQDQLWMDLKGRGLKTENTSD